LSKSFIFICYFTTVILFFGFGFYFDVTATTEIYTLSLHDALPIFVALDRLAQPLAVLADLLELVGGEHVTIGFEALLRGVEQIRDRKSTRLNSSHVKISYAVFCLKKKKMKILSLNIPMELNEQHKL